MQTIKKLSPDLIAKIAAGEVVERPASIVKELVENSIDAGATHISIFLEEGGIKKIVIKDNGKGMHEDDVMMSFLPHTTSKLFSHDDLFSISSFGFRGEALYTIGAVSQLTIRSRPLGKEFGFEVEINQGEIERQAPVGMPEGTHIRVESLFHKTPARRKFLRDPKNELRSIVTITTNFALSFPHISFELLNDDDSILNLPASPTLSDRIEKCLGEQVIAQSLPLNFESNYGKISGFIGKPQLASRAKSHQYIFVNNRAVTDELVSTTITSAFGSLIEPRSYPVFVVSLTLPFENVDVNVHPRKEEVAYAYPHHVKELLFEAVTQLLKNNNLTYTDPYKPYSIHNEPFVLRDRSMDTHMASLLRKEITPWHVKPQNEEIIQLHNLYLIAETERGILMIDQHAAHERILFEQFKEAFHAVQHNLELFTLPEPVVFSIPTSDGIALQGQLEVFQKLGFDIEPFGGQTFKLCALPSLFKNRDYRKLITEVLDNIQSGNNKNGKIDCETERTLAYLACRTAIKAGDPLSLDERKELVKKLLEADGIYTCPHGRPTHIEVSMNEMDRMFKRK